VSIAELERFIDRWTTDPGFRSEVRADPEGAISRAGYDLDDPEWSAVAETDWSLPESELRTRLARVSGSPPA
jgi:hypothetical protein